MALERIGKCRYCDYEPVANTARACPKCGGTSPYEGGFPWMLSLVALMAIALIAGGAYVYFRLL